MELELVFKGFGCILNHNKLLIVIINMIHMDLINKIIKKTSNLCKDLIHNTSLRSYANNEYINIFLDEVNDDIKILKSYSDLSFEEKLKEHNQVFYNYFFNKYKDEYCPTHFRNYFNFKNNIKYLELRTKIDDILEEEDFISIFQHRTGRIKNLLLNQRIISGLGNIYASESLYRAGIDPRRRPYRLTRKRIAGLHKAIRHVLQAATRHGGSRRGRPGPTTWSARPPGSCPPGGRCPRGPRRRPGRTRLGHLYRPGLATAPAGRSGTWR